MLFWLHHEATFLCFVAPLVEFLVKCLLSRQLLRVSVFTTAPIIVLRTVTPGVIIDLCKSVSFRMLLDIGLYAGDAKMRRSTTSYNCGENPTVKTIF